jgi:hypothetical protein
LPEASLVMPIAFLRLACAVRPEYASRIVAVLAGSVPKDAPDGAVPSAKHSHAS